MSTQFRRLFMAEELQDQPEPEPLVTWLNVRDFTLGAVSTAIVIAVIAARSGLAI